MGVLCRTVVLLLADHDDLPAQQRAFHRTLVHQLGKLRCDCDVALFGLLRDIVLLYYKELLLTWKHRVLTCGALIARVSSRIHVLLQNDALHLHPLNVLLIAIEVCVVDNDAQVTTRVRNIVSVQKDGRVRNTARSVANQWGDRFTSCRCTCSARALILDVNKARHDSYRTEEMPVHWALIHHVRDVALHAQHAVLLRGQMVHHGIPHTRVHRSVTPRNARVALAAHGVALMVQDVIVHGELHKLVAVVFVEVRSVHGNRELTQSCIFNVAIVSLQRGVH
mmetsp:Transcript_23470/g.61706  ORF Transcript_23470/g.61706 Transcript_23470/m.61706 type:complete len:280 (-) Transcript_23470:726-1565(-)